jgi:ParB/RepB/Spo0J family partition protein
MNPNSIHRSPFQLRPVRKHTVAYLGLRNSIRTHGVLQPVLVRETERGTELIDGAHRHECCLDLNLDCPVRVVNMTDEQVLEVQVIANEQRIETLDADLVKRLWKLSKRMDHKTLANRLGKSISWLKQVCQLERLTPYSMELLDKGKLTFRQAVLLSRVPRENQEQCWGMDEAQLQHVIRCLKLEGRMPTVVGVTPYYRPIRQVVEESERPLYAGQIIMNETNGNPIEIWKAALRWAMQMDSETFGRRLKKFERERNQTSLGDGNLPD